jgi:hypothetical protein
MSTTLQDFDLRNGTALAAEVVRARVEQHIADLAVYHRNNVASTGPQKIWAAGILAAQGNARIERDAIIAYVQGDSQVGDQMDDLAAGTLKGIVEAAVNTHRIV